MAATGRPLRADARRNRDAILAAAGELFAERGLDVPLDTIAVAAGVGGATRRRHFPTRASLVQALFDEQIGRVIDTVDESGDPARSFERMLASAFAAILANRSLVEMANSRYVLADSPRRVTAGTRERIAASLRVAQEAGRIRADLRPADFFLLLAMLGAVARIPAHDSADDHVDRGLGLVMEAIASGAARPASGRSEIPDACDPG